MTPALLSLWLCTAPPGAEDLTGSDKLLHAGATASIALAGYGAAALLDAPLPARLALGGGAAAAAGLAKEGIDLAGFGTPSVGDLLFDALGLGAGLGIALALDAVLRSSEPALSQPDAAAQP